MKKREALNQSIAVFGESGSGKTVLLSSFYGELQEPRRMREGLVRVLANNPEQGSYLHRNFLGMKDSAQLPATTRFLGIPYGFSVKLREGNEDVMRLTWHDYPGEWFEQNLTGEEAKRRVNTFRGLLGSDVAFVLVDGQRLLDNAGEEERYLKSLFVNLSNGLALRHEELKVQGKLMTFPRIWILALSKADLLPDYDVFKFRDLIISKVDDEVSELRRVLADLLESPEALSVGEDFVLLSSAKFEGNSIEVTKRIGLDLIFPLAAILPFERHLRWIDQNKVGRDLIVKFFSTAGPLIATMNGKAGVLIEKFAPRTGKIFRSLSPLVDTAIASAFQQAKMKLQEKDSEAVAKYDQIEQVLHGYKTALKKGEADGVLLLSRR